MFNDLKLLIVEDDQEFNSTLAELLAVYFKEIKSAFDGEEALEIYKTYSPDIIITDIRMPKMDGLELSKKIKKINNNQQIIILSAYDLNDYFLDSIDIGISGYILKPIDFRKVIDQLKKCAQFINLQNDRDEFQKKLTHNENYLKTVFNSSKDMIITSNGNEIEKANSAMFKFTEFENLEEFKKQYDCICDMFEKKEGYIYGKSIDGAKWVEYILDKPHVYHKAIINKDGKEYIFGVHVDILDFDEYKRYLIILTDITMLLEQQYKLEEKDALIKLQSKQAALGGLIGVIAHQLKQPLGVISLTASAQLVDIQLGETLDNKQLEEDAHGIINQVEYLSNTINDFRNFLKPNREKNTQKLKEIIDLVVKIVGKSLISNNIKVTLDLDEELTLTTFTNDLVQIVINILNNSKDAFIQNDIKSREIYINNEIYEDFIKVVVEDNAGGVDEDILDKMYECYFTTKDDDKGTGIGLYMAKDIINSHLKGSIYSYNNKIGGLTTVIELPINQKK